MDLYKCSLSRANISDFELGRVVGKGSFGEVFLCEHRASGAKFALKSIDKGKISSHKALSLVKNEKHILTIINHPFTLNFFTSFQDNTRIYFLTEYVPGGELFRILQNQRIFPLDHARFYAAEITSVFLYLHSNKIIYRDLKPENVLISSTGHVKLIDFGFATQVKEGENCMNFCGTLEYLAPEMVQRTGHGHAVDWWTLGVLLYELLVGNVPFVSQSHQALFEKIVKCQVFFPKTLDENAKDLIGKLLEKSPKDRISGNDVKNHEFFKGIDWDAVEKQEIAPPWVPILSGTGDSQYFDLYTATSLDKPNYTSQFFEGF